MVTGFGLGDQSLILDRDTTLRPTMAPNQPHNSMVIVVSFLSDKAAGAQS